MHCNCILLYIEPTVSQPVITRSDIGTADLPQFTIHYGSFSTELGRLSTYQIVVIQSGDNTDTMLLRKETLLLPQDQTLD